MRLIQCQFWFQMYFLLPTIIIIQQAISSQYGVSGIPSLILLDGASGQIINGNARGDVEQRPDGNGFPWRK